MIILQVSVSDLEGKLVGLYFCVGAYQPCIEFTEKLLNVYGKLKEKGENFEVVTIYLDEDDEADDGDNDEVEEEIQDDVEKTQEGEEPRRDDEDGETRSTTSEVQPFCRYMKLSCCYIL